MAVEERLRSKYLYKILLLILKVIPMVTAIGYALNTLFAYIGIDTPVFSNICGMSLFPWLYILVSAFVFKFCIYHRMFLYYILIIDAINMVDYYIGIPISTRNLFALHSIITILFLFLILYLYAKHNKKHTKESCK